MGEGELSVDEYLHGGHARGAWLATIEAVPDDDTLVRVTPVSQGATCGCAAAIRIPKSAIAGVRPTGERHLCCGRAFELVELRFKDGASLSLDDLLGQLVQPPSQAPAASTPGVAGPTLGSISPSWGWGGSGGSPFALPVAGSLPVGTAPTWTPTLAPQLAAGTISDISISISFMICFCIGGTHYCCGWSNDRGWFCRNTGLTCRLNP